MKERTGTISRFSQVWIEMAKGQVVVQSEEIDKAFTYQGEQEWEEKSFYPLPYSKGSLVLLCTGSFERTGSHAVTVFLHQMCCMLPQVKLQWAVSGCCTKITWQVQFKESEWCFIIVAKGTLKSVKPSLYAVRQSAGVLFFQYKKQVVLDYPTEFIWHLAKMTDTCWCMNMPGWRAEGRIYSALLLPQDRKLHVDGYQWIIGGTAFILWQRAFKKYHMSNEYCIFQSGLHVHYIFSLVCFFVF